MKTRGSDRKPPTVRTEGQSATFHSKPEELSYEHVSYLRLLYLLVISIFLAEVLAMGLISVLPPLPYQYVTLIDAGIMTVLVFPALYLLSFRPLILHIERRQKAESTVRQLSRIVEQTEDTVVVTDCSGVIEYVNPSFERLTGFSKEEVVGKTPRVLKSGLHDPAYYQNLWDTILQGGVFQSEIANRKKNGELFYEVKTITPLRDSGGQIVQFVATGKDITGRKQDEEKLRRAYDDLEMRVEARTDELRIANAELEEEIQVRRQAEEALSQSEQRLNRAQEIAHLGSWDLDLLNDQLTWSDEVYRIFGLEPQEFGATYEAFLEFVHPEDREAVNSVYAGSIRDGKDRYEIEHRIVKRSTGEIRIVHEKCEHFRDEEGQIIRSIGMVHDITERKRAEEQLRYQAALLANVNDAIVAADAQFRLTAWNSAAETLYGWKADEVLGHNGLEIVHTEWLEDDAAEMRRTIAAMGRWRGEATQVHKDGTRFPVEISSIVLYDGNKQITGYISVNRDITERKQAEETLRRYELLSEHSRDIILFMCLETGGILTANAAAVEAYGYSREELVALTIQHLRATDTQNLTPSQMSQADMKGILFETVHQRKDGSTFPVEVSAQGANIGGLRILISIIRDITERKQAEEALKESEAKYRNLFANMTEEVHFWQLVYDESGRIQTWRLVDANPPTLKTWNRATVDEIRGRTADEIFGPGSTEHYMPIIQEITARGEAYSYEDYFPQLDKFFRFTSVPLADHFITTGADITSLKKAEQALVAARDELEVRVQQRTKELVREIAERKEVERQLWLQTTAMQAAANGIIITDRHGVIQWANPALTGISGYPTSDLIGKSTAIFNSGRQSASYYSQMWETILSGQVWQGETVNRRMDGSLYVEEQTITPVLDQRGQVEHFIAIKQDITDRKRAEQELQQRNIERQALIQEEREQRQFAESLVKAVLVLNKSLRLNEVLVHILEQVREVIPYELANIVLLDGDTFYAASRQGEQSWPSGLAGTGNRFPLTDFPLFIQMIRTSQSILIEDTRQETDWINLPELEGGRSFLSTPLLVEEQVIGFVNLLASPPAFFTPTMRNRLGGFAVQAAVAIQNAWLFEQVQASTERLQSLSRRLVEIQENERLYISRELHDEAGQVLTSLLVDLRLLEKNTSQPDAILKIVAEMERSLNGVIENLHRMAMALRPASLDHVGLVAALRQHVEAVGEKHGIRATFRASGVVERLSGNVETVLYRTVQEALTNVVRHAQAARVDVVLTVRDGKLIILVEDDGVGFDPESVSSDEHLGLFGIRERTEMINGKLMIESAPGKGTTIMMEVEYADTAAGRR